MAMAVDRRTVLAAATGASLAKPAEARVRNRGPASRKPNILLIMTDQQRAYRDLPRALPLPAQEWLRERGTSFENFVVNTTPCGPSRSNLYTGQHTQHTGVYLNPNSRPYPQLLPQTPTVGHMLRDAGYRTFYKGKWHLSNLNEGRAFRSVAGGVFPNTRDILEPYGFSGYGFDGERVGLTWEGFMLDGATSAEAVGQLRDLGQDGADTSPWFMAVNFVNPHDIMFFDPTGEGEARRARANLISPLMGEPGDALYEKEWDVPLPHSFYADDLSTKPAAHRAIAATTWSFYSPIAFDNEAAWRRNQNYYFNCVRDVDRRIGEVIAALRRFGQLDNTIIILTSDHGERAGAHRLRQKGGTMYREDIGVPFVVVHPDLPGGISTEALGSAVDLVPTILHLAGVEEAERRTRHPQLHGFDLSPAFGSARRRTGRDEAGALLNYAVRYGWDAPDVADAAANVRPLPAPDLSLRRLFRGIQHGRYKFARYFAPSQHHLPRTFDDLVRYNDLELYDIQSDAHELVNLARDASSHAALIMELNGRLNRLIETEIGRDDGSEYPGPVEQYNQLSLPG